MELSSQPMAVMHFRSSPNSDVARRQLLRGGSGGDVRRGGAAPCHHTSFVEAIDEIELLQEKEEKTMSKQVLIFESGLHRLTVCKFSGTFYFLVCFSLLY